MNDITARQAAAIAAGMRAVALADGESHPAEMALIDAFCEGLPVDPYPAGVRFDTPEARAALLQSLYLTALADGALKPEEFSTIQQIGLAHGAQAADLKAAEQWARAQLLGQLQGLQIFADAGLQAAADLGVPADEARGLLSVP